MLAFINSTHLRAEPFYEMRGARLMKFHLPAASAGNDEEFISSALPFFDLRPAFQSNLRPPAVHLRLGHTLDAKVGVAMEIAAGGITPNRRA
jgi:hypothetical protein